VDDAAKHEAEDKNRKDAIEARNQLDTLLYGTRKLVAENSAKIGEAEKLMIEEEMKSAESVLDKNRDGGNADELRGAFEKLQAAAHKLAEAMYKQAGAAPGGDAGDTGGGGGGGEPAKESDVIDAEFEDKS
ncbi:MAG TPA: Hsp70 family protein, partial [Kofleriaceae bacterium]